MSHANPPTSAPWIGLVETAEQRAQRWQHAFFLVVMLALVSLGLNVYLATSSQVAVHILERNTEGQVLAVHQLPTYTEPDSALTAYFLRQFVTWVRAIPADTVLLRRHWDHAVHHLTQRGKTMLAPLAQAANDKAHSVIVDVTVLSVVPITARSYQVHWAETTYGVDGTQSDSTRYDGTVSFVMLPPKTRKTLLNNPIGLYVDTFRFEPHVVQAATP